MALHGHKGPKGNLVSASDIAPMTRRDQIYGIIVIPDAIDMIPLKKTGAALGAPRHESAAPMARMFARSDFGVKDNPVDQSQSTRGRDRATRVGANQVAVSVVVRTATARSAATTRARLLRAARR